MKTFFLLLMCVGFSLPVLSHETSAFERALEDRFGRNFSYSSIDYTDDMTNSECPLLASAYVYAGERNRSYECTVCLFDEGNGFFDYDSLNCDYAQD